MIMPKEIIRSKRKTIALVLNSQGELIIRAPYDASDAQIMEFVKAKQNWIKTKSANVKTFDEKHLEITMSVGDSVMFLGKDYTIELIDTNEVYIENKIIYIPDIKGSKERLEEWLKGQALILFSERVSRYSNLMGLKPQDVNVTNAKARWGSCSSKNNLNFAWRLVMCPLSVIDYVVVHELSHIDFKDHSSSFWNRVRTVLPFYKKEQDWLKQNKKLMEII